MSILDEKSKAKFATKYGLNFPLLADPDHAVAEKYGVWQKKMRYGREYMGIVRTTYLIDGDGKVAQRWDKVKVDGHAEDVLEELESNMKDMESLKIRANCSCSLPRRVTATRLLVSPCDTSACCRCLLPCAGAAPAAQQTADRFWPQWRGPHGTGVSRTATPPTRMERRRRTSAGRWRFPAGARRRRSSGAIACIVTTAVPTASTGAAQHAPLGGTPGRAQVRRAWRSIARRGKAVWERVRARKKRRTRRRIPRTARGRRRRPSSTAST